MQRGYICNFCCKKSHNLITEARLSGYPNNEREEIVTIFPVLFSQIWMKKIHIVEPWRMWSFCKTPSSLPPFIKPCPSLSSPPVWSPVGSYLVSKQSRNTCFGGITNGGEVVTPLQREHQPAAGQSHQLLGQVAKTCRREGGERKYKRGYRARSETGGWPLIKGK